MADGSNQFQYYFQETLLLEGLTLQCLSRNSTVVVPCETSIIAEQDAVIFVMQQFTMATGKPCKNTPYFGFSCSYLAQK